MHFHTGISAQVRTLSSLIVSELIAPAVGVGPVTGAVSEIATALLRPTAYNILGVQPFLAVSELASALRRHIAYLERGRGAFETFSAYEQNVCSFD